MTVSRVRVLAITHIVVGALLIIFGVADGVTTSSERGDIEFVAGDGFFGVWIGIWMCIAGGLGIPGSAPQRTPRRDLFAGIFMGFSITSAVFGGVIIIPYSVTIGSYSQYNNYGHGYGYVPSACVCPYEAKIGLAAVVLVLGIIEFVIGIWVSIYLCVMKPCCTGLDLEEREPLVNSVTG